MITKNQFLNRAVAVAVVALLTFTASAGTLKFNGVDSRAQQASVTGFPSTAITTEFWVRTSGPDGRCIFSYSSSTADNEWTLFSPNNLRVHVGSAGTAAVLDTGVAINDGQWHHVAASWRNTDSQVEVHVDGISVYTGVIASRVGYVLKNGGYFALGQDQDSFGGGFGDTFQGEIDEFRIWDRVLTTAEIQQTKNRALTGNETGLLLYYPVAESAGTVTTDASGHGFHAQFSGGVVRNLASDALAPALWTELAVSVTTNSATLGGWVNPGSAAATNRFLWGAGSTSLRFDGAGDEIIIPHDLALNTYPISLTTWVRIEPGGTGGLINKYSASANGWRMYVSTAGRVRAVYFRDSNNRLAGNTPGSSEVVTGPIDDGQWHHVAFTVDASGGKVFVDGRLGGSAPWTGTPGVATITAPVEIGLAAGAFLNGQIDDAAIWNTALDTNAIAALMNSGLTTGHTQYSNVVAHWAMDAGTGTFVADVSGHGHDGNIAGNPRWRTDARPVIANQTTLQSVSGPNSVLNLDGATNYVDVPDGVWFNGDFTVEFNAFVRGYSAYASFVDFGNGSNADNVLVALDQANPGNLKLWTYIGPGSSSVVATTPVPLNQWVHLAVTLQGSTATLYQDGVVVGRGTVNIPAGVLRTNTFIGRPNWPQDTYADTLMDEVRIWKIARSAAQIRQGMNQSADPSDPNLSLNYRFDESSGPTVIDSRNTSPQHGTLVNGAERLPLRPVSAPLAGLSPGSRYHYRTSAQNTNGTASGLIRGFATLNPGRGTSLEFDGKDDQLTGVVPQLPTGDSSYTIEAWIKPNVMNAGGIVGWGNYGVNNQVNVLRLSPTAGGGIRNYWWGNDQELTTGPLIGEWHHVAASFDGSKRKIYVDGVVRDEDPGSGLNVTSANNFTIGKSYTTEYFDGQIDEVRIWNVARTDAEVAQFSNERLVGNEPGLVLYQRLDEGAGTTARDSSSYATDLTLVGGPEWAGSEAGVAIPLATTMAASAVGFGFATLNGAVNLEASQAVSYRFEYGLNGGFTDATSVRSNFTGTAVEGVSELLTNLQGGQVYRFRLVAWNGNGTNYGAAQTFYMPFPASGYAMNFDGTNYVNMGDSAALKVSSALTIEAWIYPTGPGSDGTGGIIVNKEGEYEVARYPDGTLRWAIRNTSPGWAFVNTGVVAPSNQWMHVGFVYGGGSMRLYTNGVLASTHTASGNITDFNTSQNELWIGGRQAGGQRFQGAIDEVRVWNVTRSAAEVLANYNRLLAGNETGLLLYLHFDEGSGNTTYDSAPNHFIGTLVGNPTFVPSGAQPTGPLVTTLAATPVLATSATLRGLVNPSSESVITYFEYGPTVDYGGRTNTGSYNTTLMNLPLSAKLEQLEPGTTYHYRLVAYNTSLTRTNYGADQTFNTLVLGSGWPVSTKLAAGEASNPIHVLDGLGNSYVAGVFSGAAVFRSPLSPTGGATANAFVGKMSRTADWLWAVNIPASAGGFTRIKAVGVDADRNIYIAGQFSGTNTFGGTNLVSLNNTNFFVAKLDSSGTNWLWAHSVGGAGVDSANALTVAGTNLFIAGSFSGVANFGVSNLVSSGANDAFAAALDLNGNWLWANRGGGASNAAATTLATDANNSVYLAGNYSGSVTFNTTPSVTTLTNAGGTDLFVAKLTSAGTWVLARRGGSTNNDVATALVRDPTTTIPFFYLVGQFGGTADYGGTLDNQNIGNNTNIFVLRLGTEALYTDYTQGGSSVPRSATVDSHGLVYVCGEFLFSTSIGTNNLNASGNSDVFIAQMAGGHWTWAQKLGSAGTETGGSIAVDADDTVVVSGTYQGTVQIGYVALSTPNNQDIFVARLDANRVYEHNNYLVGQPIPVPGDAQDSDYGDGAFGLPAITILEKDRLDSDAINSFAWSEPEHKLFPVREVTAIFKWPLTKNQTNTSAVVTAVGRIRYPANPVIHIANTPVDLEPAVPGFPLKFAYLAFTSINGADVDASTKQFTAPAPGWSVLQFLDTGGGPIDVNNPSKFEVVRTVNWNDQPYLIDNQTARVGEALSFTNHSDPAGKNGYVYFENSFYDGTGDERAYDRASRTGPIIPVNKDTASATDDLVVVWSQVSANGIAWPGKPVRYVAEWPTNAAELVLSSRLGSEPLDLLEYPSKRVYSQPDRNLPGFNPNEEHAALYGNTLYALRNDLNSVVTPKASDPYTLLKYIDPGTGNWTMKVYKVVSTNSTFPLTYNGVAGSELPLPEPLAFLSLCNQSNRVVSGPGFQDYIGQLYARAAGPGGSATNIVARYWYPLQSDFFFDLNLDGTPDAPVGTCVPWLDRRPGGTAGTPVDITYNISWPVGAPKLELGDTWFGARPAVSDLSSGLTNLASLLSANIIYDQGNPFATNSLESLARLFDPLAARTQQLAMGFVLPATIATFNDAGLRRFTDLPYSLRARLRYDNLNKRLIFSGLLNDSDGYGGPDHPLLLVNVLSPRERERIKELSTDTAFQSVIDDLYDLTRNPNRLDVDGNGQPDKTLLIGLAYNSQTNGARIVPEKLGNGPKALTAGPGTGTGFVTVVENNDPMLAGFPVTLHVIEIAGGPFCGDLKVLYPDNVFDEKLTVRHSGDFGGEPQRFEFAWYYMPDDPALNHTNLPSVDANGEIMSLNGWTNYPGVPPGANGFNDVTIGDGIGGLLTLADNWFICRYRGYAANGETNWSDWVGNLEGTGPKFAQGWVKRVLFGLNPFDTRTTNFHENASITFASMLQQAGARYEGDIAPDSSGANLNSIGLIEAYETVLRRARKLSVDAGINYPAANNALILAASRISDLYILLGNEAYADAADPTIGFRTDNAGYGTLAPSIFTFQNQLDSLLEEELVLLRGRDDKSATVRSAPVYNRLFWNFTHAEGEVAYAQAYNITDQSNDGIINASDARILYPQGHGDAWGHYLTATKTCYSLLQSTNFDWVPRSEFIELAGVTVKVDYQDERKFARAAAAKAKTGAELVDLTYRISYVDDPAGQYQGYKDTDPSRAWGLSEWAHRAGSGAFFDWVTVNAILPASDPITNHVGIEKIDRTTVTEIAEIVSGYESVQSQADKADAGLNPLGLAKNVVPFDIDPSQIDAGKTHFEQIYDRAIEAMNNTVTVFNHANQLSQALRSLQDSVNDFSKNADQQERDLKNRLIEIFGYPYAGDIGAGKIYPSGYDGPDLYHYMYVNLVEFTGDPEALKTNIVSGGGGSFPTPQPQPIKAFFSKLSDQGVGLVGHYFPADLPVNVVLPSTNLLEVQYPVAASDYSFSAPASWGRRRAPGELQSALSDLLQAETSLKRARVEHFNHVQEMEDKADLLQAKYDLQTEKLLIRVQSRAELVALRAIVAAAKLTNRKVTEVEKKSDKIVDATVESMPKSAGTSTDVTAPLRGAAKFLNFAKNLVLGGIKFIAESVEETTKEKLDFLEYREGILIDAAEFRAEIQKELKELEKMLREEEVKRFEMLTQAQKLDQVAGAYEAALARGLRLVEERIDFRKNTAAETQSSRYQDMTFRIFRNDAIQKYRAQFDLAARYVFLAAVAYDFETQLLGVRSGAGSTFLTDIVRQRSLGELINGVPVAGRHGLADPLARLNQNFGVLKGQLGFNNPQTETGRFSVRSELFRLRDSSDAEWRAALRNRIVPNLWDIPEFRRYCRPFAPESAGPQPGLVIRFPTTINFGFNYFGWPLGGGDSAYDSTLFATKVRSAGVWFSDYNGSGLSVTPRLYLVPVGADVMRSPSGNNLEIREWRVVDQKIPVPFPIGFSSLNNNAWIPMNDSLSDTFGDVRRFSSYRAYHDSGVFNESETITDSRLIGRSVWNTDWMLIIPGGTFLFDPNEGLDTFINSASDIKIFFQTYSYSGN